MSNIEVSSFSFQLDLCQLITRSGNDLRTSKPGKQYLIVSCESDRLCLIGLGIWSGNLSLFFHTEGVQGFSRSVKGRSKNPSCGIAISFPGNLIPRNSPLASGLGPRKRSWERGWFPGLFFAKCRVRGRAGGIGE